MVGTGGFEPPASCSQGRRATRLRYAPTVKTKWEKPDLIGKKDRAWYFWLLEQDSNLRQGG